MSADGDAVPLWALRSGALAVQPTLGGVLATAGNGASGTGVQRVTIANDSTGILAAVTNVATIGTSVTPGTGAAHLGKAEDAAHSSGDTGVLMLGVRQDADSSPVSATGDYQSFLFDSSGNLKVNIKAGAGSGGTAMTDAAAFTRGTTSVTPVAAVVETSAPTLTNGNSGALSLTTAGALRVSVASGGIAGVTEDAASAGGEEGVMLLAVRRDVASSGVSADGDFAALSVTSDGSLRVSGSSGTTQYAEDVASVGGESLCLAGAVRQDTLASNTSADGDYTYLKTTNTGRLYTAADQTHVGGTAVATGNGTASAGCARITIASDNTAFTVTSQGGAAQDAAITGQPVPVGLRASTATPTAMSADGDVVYPWATREGAQVVAGAIVDDAAFTPGTSRVVPIGFQADETATDSVDEGDAGTPRMTLDRKVITASYVHAAAGGATPYQNLDVDETEDDVKTSAGRVFWVHAMNLSATKKYLKFYNATAANVTVGTTTPVLTLPLPTMGDTNGAGFTINFGDVGVQFDTAICIASTTGFAVADTGAPGTNEVIVNLGYA
jgi:hypothetical protein